MRKDERLLAAVGDTLREVARDLTRVTDTLSALKVVAEHDRLPPKP
jgi:hypothetical protein